MKCPKCFRPTVVTGGSGYHHCHHCEKRFEPVPSNHAMDQWFARFETPLDRIIPEGSSHKLFEYFWNTGQRNPVARAYTSGVRSSFSGDLDYHELRYDHDLHAFTLRKQSNIVTILDATADGCKNLTRAAVKHCIVDRKQSDKAVEVCEEAGYGTEQFRVWMDELRDEFGLNESDADAPSGDAVGQDRQLHSDGGVDQVN